MRSRNLDIRMSKSYKRFILSFTVILILPIIFFIFLFLNNYRTIYRDKVMEQENASLDTVMMQLERNIENFHQIVLYNSQQEYLKESYIKKQLHAVDVVYALNSEAVTQNFLETIYYHTKVNPNVVFNDKGTFSLEYFVTLRTGYDSVEQFEELLQSMENKNWILMEPVSEMEDVSRSPLCYFIKKGSNEWWMFQFSPEIMQEIFYKENTATVLLDSDGTLLFSAGDTAEKQGQKYYEMSCVSADESFTLVRRISEKNLFEEVNRWQNSFFIMVCLILLLGGFAVLLLSAYHEQPIRQLKDDCEKLYPSVSGGGDVFDMFRQVLKSTENRMAILERKQKKELLLLRMIYEKDYDEAAYNNALKEASLFVYARGYRVIVAVADEIEESVYQKLELYLNVLSDKECEMHVVNGYSTNSAVILAGLSKNADSILEKKLFDAADTLEKEVSRKIHFYVGGKSNSLQGIYQSYQTAVAESKTEESEEKKPVVYGKAVQSKVSKFLYPDIELGMLYDALTDFNAQKADMVMETIIDIMKNQESNRFVSVALYYDIINSYYRAMTKLEMDSDEKIMNMDMLEIRDTDEAISMIYQISRRFWSYVERVNESTLLEKKEKNIVSQVLAFIDENSNERDLSASMVANHFNMSLSNLGHQFKAGTDRKLSEYITEKKFMYSCRLLKETDYNVAVIADMIGYSQTHSFIRKFKQFYGMTPVEYRNKEEEEK